MRIGHKLIIPLIIIAIGNMVEGITMGYEPKYFIVNVSVFIVFILVLLLSPKRDNDMFMSVSLLIFSLIGAWFGDYTDINCVLLLIFAIHISGHKKKTHIIYISIFASALIIKYSWLGLNIPQLLVFTAGVSSLLIMYYHYMTPKDVNSTKVLIDHSKTEMPKKYLDIVVLRAENCDWHEITDRLTDREVKHDTVRRDFAEIRDATGFPGNDFAFGFHCSQSGFLTTNSLEDDTDLN